MERPLASASSLLPSTASPAPPCGGALSTFSACGDAAGQSGNGGGEEDATVGGTSEYVTPPAGSKQQQRAASELANTVYAGVKHKMSLMKEEVRMREPTSAAAAAKTARPLPMHLRRPQLVTLTASFLLFLLAPLSSTIPRLACSLQLVTLRQARWSSNASSPRRRLSKHVELNGPSSSRIRRTLAKQCEGLTAQMRQLEDKYSLAEAKREEAFARELRKQKEVWAAAEKAKREQWLADKTKEIKEATVRGLEPDIQRLVTRHREEARKLEEGMREEHRREMLEERTTHQREMSRLQEASVAERHAAQEREREVCGQKLHEMSLHFEEQLRQQRARQSSSHAAELEERDEMRRREIARLEGALRESKEREEEARAAAAAEKAAVSERLSEEAHARLEKERRQHASARKEWEAGFEAAVAARVATAKASLDAAAAEARDAQIGVVVNRLSEEMAQAEKQWQARLDAANRNADARVADAQRQGRRDARRRAYKYMAAVERTSELEARLRATRGRARCAREACGAREVEAERLPRAG